MRRNFQTCESWKVPSSALLNFRVFRDLERLHELKQKSARFSVFSCTFISLGCRDTRHRARPTVLPCLLLASRWRCRDGGHRMMNSCVFCVCVHVLRTSWNSIYKSIVTEAHIYPKRIWLCLWTTLLYRRSTRNCDAISKHVKIEKCLFGTF